MLSQSLSIFADIPVHFKEVSTQIVASNGGHPCTSISFSLLHEGDVQNYNFILPEQELRIQVDVKTCRAIVISTQNMIFSVRLDLVFYHLTLLNTKFKFFDI
jgi:hypothetical protein